MPSRCTELTGASVVRSPQVAPADCLANRRHGLAESLAVGARRRIVNHEERHTERDQGEESGQHEGGAEAPPLGKKATELSDEDGGP